MGVDDSRLASVIRAAAGYHPVGFICNWLMVSALIAAVGIAVFKQKILGAVILVVVALVVRFIVMYLLKIYLVMKYR
ncbi:hypothetical protein [Pseudomonas fluorescens]|uniref:hypothetical protein n=1 Tax=Pseudomonas fluorescens TaxID=294 RepID=UPI001BE65CBD|nr:hypothetical protein [Pseudomonas fluorescens]MBT2373159.1 hypothetical protein [Pseudomonas fluorescens]